MSARIDIESNDEVGELARTINKMAQSVSQAQKSLKGEKEFEQIQGRSILDSTGEGIVVTDENGLVSYANPAFVQMTGFTNKELKQKDFAGSVPAFDLKEVPIPASKRGDKAAASSKIQKLKFLLGKRDGSKVAVEVNIKPIYVGEGFKGFIRVFHDFSEDLRIQKQKDDFFSIASHELRTPLTAISGNLDMLLAGHGKSKISRDDKQLIADAVEASDRLIEMVNAFLNVSRLDQGRLETNPSALDSCKLTGEIVAELTPLVKQKKLTISYNCAKDHGGVMADEGLLKQILINLVGNSIKFTEKGGVTVDHTVRDNMLVTTVTDTGPGIEIDNQKLLFQRFQQAMDRTLAREAGGTGLGLYISREFARLMAGDLVLQKSVLGKGSIFELTLPLADSKTK